MDNKKIIAVFVLIASLGVVAALGIKKAHDHFSGPVSNWFWSDSWPESSAPPATPPQNTQPPANNGPGITASSLEEAKSLSAQNNRPILMMFTADWCGFCSKMKTETMKKGSVKSAMARYVFLMVNSDQNQSVVSQYGVRGLPTFVIADSTGKKVKQSSGYKDESSFLEFLGS